MVAKSYKIFKTLVILAACAIPITGYAHHTTLPLPAADDLWDVSQGTVVTSHSALHTSQSFDARDLLGGTFGDFPGEDRNVIFADLLPMDTVHHIEWQTAQPITLESFRLFAFHRTSRPANSSCTFPDARVRGFKQFRLFAKGTSGEWEKIYELDPLVNGHYHIANEEYQGILQFDRPTQGDPILHEGDVTPIYTREFRAEFIQGGDPDDTTQCNLWRNATGPRVVELDGFGSTEPPEPDEPDPIVLIPGMVTSLNLKRIFTDEEGGAWFFAPQAHEVYKALLERFNQQGFTENQNLFIAHYDWRNPVSAAASNYLKPMIDYAKQVTGAEKVDIVTHSMGGLVARSYIQSENYEDDVDQLITMGTPHLGASDAYIAWEGGEFPERWGLGIRLYLQSVENALRIRRAAPLPRPLSFRAFFPSLKDLLPTEDFITRNNTPFPVGDQAEPNFFLQALKNTASRLADRGVDVTTIAGNNLPTLNQIFLSGNRTSEDIARERWRDGHPDPDPPLTDTSLGDQTVLLTSALFGNNTITKPNIAHDKLPEAAQEEVLEALGLGSSGPHIAYDTPDSLVGTVVLSPITPSITLPNGTTFICDSNKQTGSAECVVDETDPNGPKFLVIANPANGQYQLTFTGTGGGEYHAITCFADDDSDNCSTRAGTTQTGQVDTSLFAIGDNSYTAPAEDTFALLEQLKDTIHQLLIDKHLAPQAQRLHGLAASLADHGAEYGAVAETSGLTSPEAEQLYQKVRKSFAHFSEELEQQITAGNLDDTAIVEITGLADQLRQAGL